MPGKDTNTGAKRARELRAALSLASSAPATCLLDLVENRMQIPVVIAALPNGIAGCCWRDGDRTLLWVNGRHPPVRQRFTLAHEVGHVRCGHYGTTPVETVTTLSRLATESREVQANAFAAELLAPASGVREMAGDSPTLEEVVRIAHRYGISTLAALFRLNTLGLTRRSDRLRREIDEGLDHHVARALDLEPLDDGIAALDQIALPRLSPVLRASGLQAMIEGRSGVGDVAAQAGCDPATLAAAAATIGV